VYRVSRFVRKHRVTLGIASTFVLLLFARDRLQQVAGDAHARRKGAQTKTPR
jgi:hypothetical protein